jgi:hypothetical protein
VKVSSQRHSGGLVAGVKANAREIGLGFMAEVEWNFLLIKAVKILM